MDANPKTSPLSEADLVPKTEIPLQGNHLSPTENWSTIKKICDKHDLKHEIILDDNILDELKSENVDMGKLAEAFKQFEKTYEENHKRENIEKSPAKEQENTVTIIADVTDSQIRNLCGAISSIKGR